MAAPLVIWDSAMLRYELSPEHPLNPLRLDLTIALATELGVLSDVDLVSPTPGTDDVLRMLHTQDYIDAVRAASEPHDDWWSTANGLDADFGLGTPDNPIFVGMHDVSALIAGGSVQAAAALATGTVDRAINIAGGLHHAMAGRASGFCVYNDAALAIHELLRRGVERVAYIDVDVHHGDGVQAAFYDDPRVLTVSLHESPLTLFPGTGRPSETGGPAAVGASVNVALPVGTGDSGWLRAFHAVVPGVLAAFRPQVVVSQHGADTHDEDPLAHLRLSVDGQRAAHLAVRELADRHGGRWLALGGGGYSLVRVVPRSWTHLLGIVLDRDVAPTMALPPGFRRRAARYLNDNGALRGGLPLTMSDGTPASYAPWDGSDDAAIDRAIMATRSAVYPLWGLDPHDPRD